MALLKNIVAVATLSLFIVSCGKPPAYTAEFFTDTLSDSSDGPQLSIIPAGKGIAGEEYTTSTGYLGPQRSIKNSKAFAITRAEITFAQYDKFANATNRASPDDRGWGRGDMPVINVSWMDATAYAKWLTEQTNQHYRLPSETEWEYAARAGSGSALFFGNDINKVCTVANVADETPLKNTNVWTNRVSCKDQYSFTAPVGQFQSNKYGLYDMIGNVMELTDDCYNSSFASAPTNGKPWNSGNCNVRVIRGAAFNYGAEYLRSSKRNTVEKSGRKIDIGFRLAHSIEE